MPVMTTTPETHRARRGALVVLMALSALWVVWGIWFVMAPDTNPGGQCSGLGFGCTLTPHDFAAFAGAIVVAPLTVVVVVVTLVVRVVRIGRGSPRTMWDVLLGVLLLLVVALWLVATVAGSL